MIYLYMILVGLIVAILTELFTSRKEAMKLPGGSLAAGFALAIGAKQNLLIGAILGLLGWAVFLLLCFIIARIEKDV
jgi:hypothetical protein